MLGGVPNVFHDGCRQLSVTSGDHIILSSAADDVLGRVIYDGVQTALSVGDGRVQGLGKFQRIVDLPQNVTVADHGLLVTGDDIGGRQIIEQDLLWELIDALYKRNLKGNTCRTHYMVYFTELSDQTVFVFVGNDNAGGSDDQQHQYQ